MSKDVDAARVRDCLAGNPQAFAALVERYEKPVFNVAVRMLRNPEDARDVAQTVFLKAYQNLSSYDPQFKFYSWIYRMAINESLNMLRRNGREQALDEETDIPGEESANPEWQLSEAQVSRRVQAALMRMKADDRVVITLRHFSECSYREIALILELDEKTVKSRLYEARSRLRGLLTELRGDGK